MSKDMRKEPAKDLDPSYLRKFKARDAALQANGFPPSKLGPGVPAETDTNIFGTTVWDDSGMKISGGGK